jgi:hypothetical protein
VFKSFFFILLLLKIYQNPSAEGILFYASIFGMLISGWQILHALYVVKKYKDWQRQQYLYSMRQVLGYGLLTLGVGLFMLIASFGFLFPFFYFTITILHWILLAVVLFLAGNYFIISFRRLYEHLYRPKSFWDL